MIKVFSNMKREVEEKIEEGEVMLVSQEVKKGTVEEFILITGYKDEEKIMNQIAPTIAQVVF